MVDTLTLSKVRGWQTDETICFTTMWEGEDSHSIQLLQLVREVQAVYGDSSEPVCATLSKRCGRLEKWLAGWMMKGEGEKEGLLWIDEVQSSLDAALGAGRRIREKNDNEVAVSRACFPGLFRRKKHDVNALEYETIRVSSRVVHEWLSASAALYREKEEARQQQGDDVSNISLGDPAPHLSEQFVPVHRETRDKVKLALVDAQRSAAAAGKAATVFMRGVRGVGKSVLAATLVRDPVVTHLFNGGSAWLQLGCDAGEEDVCDAVVAMVDSLLGGAFEASVRTEMTLAGIVAQARSRIGSEAALIVLDDAYGRWGCEALEAVLAIVSGSSVVLITTTADVSSFMSSLHNAAIAFEVEIQRFMADSDDNCMLFDSWMHGQLEDHDRARVDALKQVIINECRGLPLALAMAAGSISKSVDAWDTVAEALISARKDEDDDGDGDGYDPSATITALLDELLERGDFRFGAQMRALASLPRGAWVSLRTLGNLWDVDDGSVKASARRLVKLSFGEYRLSDSVEQSAVRLNWHVANYCVGLVCGEELAKSHEALLNKCAKRDLLTASNWWCDALRDDYMRRRLCWHMVCAGALDDLRSLLCEYSWMTNRVATSSSYGLRIDLEMCISLLEQGEDSRGLVGFRAVRNCLGELCRSRRGQSVDTANLAPILVTRLKAIEGDDEAMVRAVLVSVDNDAKRPWLKPVHELEFAVGAPQPMEDAVEDDIDEVVVDGSEEAELVGEFEANESDDFKEKVADGSSVVSMTSNSLGYVVVGEASGRISVWDVHSAELRVVFDVPQNARRKAVVGALACLGDDVVVSGHGCGTLRLWSIREGKQTHELIGLEEQEAVTALAIHEPDIVVSGTAGGAVLLWANVFGDAGQSARVQLLGDHTDEVTALCILPGAKRVVSGSYDGFAWVWDVTRPDSERVSLNGHEDYVKQFAGVGTRRVASACHGGSVSVWDAVSGARLWGLNLGFEFGCDASLAAFAQYNYGRGGAEMGAKVGFPYFCTRGELDGEMVVVTTVGQNDVVASTEFGGVVSDWLELWHPDEAAIYVVVALGNGTLTTVQLVTAL